MPGDLPLGLDLCRRSRPGRGVWARVSLNDLPCLGDSALCVAASRPMFGGGLPLAAPAPDHIDLLGTGGGGGALGGVGFALTGSCSPFGTKTKLPDRPPIVTSPKDWAISSISEFAERLNVTPVPDELEPSP